MSLSVLLQAGVPPANIPFVAAAFLVTGVALLGYGLYVFRRRKEAEREVRGLEDAANPSGEEGRV